jgi:hypothetical protein
LKQQQQQQQQQHTQQQQQQQQSVAILAQSIFGSSHFGSRLRICPGLWVRVANMVIAHFPGKVVAS